MLNTIKRLKPILLIILCIFKWSTIYAYEIKDSGISGSVKGTIRNWDIIQYFPGEITIIRSSAEKTGDITINFTGNLITSSNFFTEGADVSESIGFQYSINPNNGITGTFSSPTTNGGDNFVLLGPNIINGHIDLNIEDNSNLEDTITVSGAIELSIPLSLDDGIYNLTFQLITTSLSSLYPSVQTLPITIVTTPVVQVEDIDFGRQIKGVGEVVRTGNITVTGKEGAELSYTLETSGKFVQAGGDSTIPFTSEVIAGGSSKVVDGESTATLQVTTNISDDVDPGKYTGSVRVLVQHN